MNISTVSGGVRMLQLCTVSSGRVSRLAPPRAVGFRLPETAELSVGDAVLRGQILAGSGCGAVRSSVSGTVSSVTRETAPDGRGFLRTVIENDFSDTLSPDCVPFGQNIAGAAREQLAAFLETSGIPRYDGSGEPLAAKVRDADGKVRALLVDCTDAGPFSAAAYRYVAEYPKEVVNGAKILMKTLGVSRCVFAAGDTRPEAVNRLLLAVGNADYLSVRVVEDKYPVGDERVLYAALTGKETPAGGDPTVFGAFVCKAMACGEVFRRFAYGVSGLDRIVTVCGDRVSSPGNYLVPIGTPLSHIAEECGAQAPVLCLPGGTVPAARWGETYAEPETDCLVFSEERKEKQGSAADCLMCGRCAEVCPVHLRPASLLKTAGLLPKRNYPAQAAAACIGCFACSYVCPAFLPVGQSVLSLRDRPDEDGEGGKK